MPLIACTRNMSRRFRYRMRKSAFLKSLTTTGVLLHFLAAIVFVSAEDVFCGQLAIYKQQWFAKDTPTISSKRTADLRECLNTCCNITRRSHHDRSFTRRLFSNTTIPECNAITFMGFLEPKLPEGPSANCLMFSCRGNCVVTDAPTATTGVVSVIINRTIVSTTALG